MSRFRSAGDATPPPAQTSISPRPTRVSATSRATSPARGDGGERVRGRPVSGPENRLEAGTPTQRDEGLVDRRVLSSGTQSHGHPYEGGQWDGWRVGQWVVVGPARRGPVRAIARARLSGFLGIGAETAFKQKRRIQLTAARAGELGGGVRCGHRSGDIRVLLREDGQDALQAPPHVLEDSQPPFPSLAASKGGSQTVHRSGLVEDARACGSSAWPTAVSCTLRRRWKSRTPSSRSRRATCWLTDGWAMCRGSAARPKCGVSATATKYLSSRSSTTPSHRHPPAAPPQPDEAHRWTWLGGLRVAR